MFGHSIFNENFKDGGKTVTIEFKDIVLLNDELRKQHTRYRIVYKNENTACIEPPGECCLTENMKKKIIE